MPGFSVTGFQHAAINTNDFEGTVAFYRDAFGFTVEWQIEMAGEFLSTISGLSEPRARIAMLTAGTQSIEVWQYLEPLGEDKRARPHDLGITHFGLVLTDLQKAYEELQSKGVRFNCPPQLVSGGRMKGWSATYCYDPNGILLELMQPPAPSAS
ncbi:MAG: VOC family protein [Chloroflexota bacterium]|nr:MAG: VOC family protein [Chloroflexota bacterium]